jgi:endonuclease G
MASLKQEKLRRHLERIAPVVEVEALADETVAREMVPAAVSSGRQRDLGAAAVHKLATNQPLTPRESFFVEAIVLPDKRPVIDIIDGDFEITGPLFTHFSSDDAVKQRLLDAIPAIGRIDFPDHPTLPYGGTGFVVGDGLLMTNRHVAELFASGLGTKRLTFHSDFSVGIDFRRERDRTDSEFFDVREVLMIHPYWDMALLAVDGLDGAFHRPLQMSLTDPEDLRGDDIAVIGYPAFDPRNDAEVQNRVFGGIYYVKRLQPGRLNDLARIRSFGKSVDAATHDSSTLGGNSGSAVIDIQSGNVVALHFAGRYLEANYAVPAAELARDRRVVDAGVQFAGQPKPTDTLWDDRWRAADAWGPDEAGGRGTDLDVATAPNASEEDGALVFRIPIEVTVRVGTVDRPARAEPSAPIEKMVEPIHELDYETRHGYDPEFIGPTVALPEITEPDLVSKMDNGEHVIPYHHFSLVMHKTRRLAVFTAANGDADDRRKRPEPGKNYSRPGLGGLRKNKDREKWFTDPRIQEQHQLPNRFFDKDRKAFDKGHLVRRETVAWGSDYEEVQFANGDTFHATNCSPQVAGFNRSNLHGVWGKLENMVLKQAEDEKLCVMAGPVLATDDQFFSGVDDDGPIRVRIPKRYWKVVVARKGSGLQVFAFDLKQDLSDVAFEFLVDDVWRERMISLEALEQDLGIVRFPADMHAADQAHTADGEALSADSGLELIR